MQPVIAKYLKACFNGLSDRNATVRRHYASAMGHLIGYAKVCFLFILECELSLSP